MWMSMYTMYRQQWRMTWADVAPCLPSTMPPPPLSARTSCTPLWASFSLWSDHSLIIKLSDSLSQWGIHYLKSCTDWAFRVTSRIWWQVDGQIYIVTCNCFTLPEWFLGQRGMGVLLLHPSNDPRCASLVAVPQDGAVPWTAQWVVSIALVFCVCVCVCIHACGRSRYGSIQKINDWWLCYFCSNCCFSVLFKVTHTNLDLSCTWSYSIDNTMIYLYKVSVR